MSISRLVSITFKIMPLWLRKIVYKFKYPYIGISPSVEIDRCGIFEYKIDCKISKDTNIVIHPKGHLIFSENVYIGRNVEIGSDDITIGFDSSIQDRCVLLGSITIGANCILAPNVFISSGGHHFDINPYLLIREQDKIGIKTVPHKPVFIEDDCWIGINSVVMPGVTIGKGSVIGAGSIVTKNIPPYSICVGSPSKIIKKRLEFYPPTELFALEDTSLPYFYSGFRYNYKNNKRRIFVSENEFSFSLNLDKAESIKLFFYNHNEVEATLVCAEKTYILPVGKSEVSIDASGVVDKHNMLVINILDRSFLQTSLEVISVKVKKELEV